MPVIRDENGNYLYLVSVSHEIEDLFSTLYPKLSEMLAGSVDFWKTAQRPTIGQEIASGLDMEVGDWVIGVASERLVSDEHDWPLVFANALAETNPKVDVLYSSFDKVEQTLGETVSVQGYLYADGQHASVTIRNGSVEDEGLAYHTSRISQMYPERPNLVIVSVGHTYDEATPASYLASLDAFVSALHAIYPDVPLLLTSQNPSFAFESDNESVVPRSQLATLRHRERFSALRTYAQENEHGYLPIFEIMADPQYNGGASLVLEDGWRPTSDPEVEPNATQLWGRLVSDYFANMAYRRRDYSIVT